MEFCERESLDVGSAVGGGGGGLTGVDGVLQKGIIRGWFSRKVDGVL